MDVNAVPPQIGCKTAFLSGGALNAFRPAATSGSIAQFEHDGKSDYHSLQVLFRSRLGNSHVPGGLHVWSHSIGNVQLDNSSGSINPRLSLSKVPEFLDKGNTNINRPHIFVANEVFFLPKLTNQHASFGSRWADGNSIAS